MQNSMVMFAFFVFGQKYGVWDNLFQKSTFSVFDRKYPFSANLIQKVKTISWSWNLVPRLIQLCRIQWWCSLFLFLIGNTLFGQIWPRKLKLSVQGETWYLTNSNMQNSLVMFTFFCFRQEIPCLGQFGPKNQICQLKMKLDT